MLSASSAMPRANLPRMFAVAGATSSRSASSAREMCRISPFSPSANWSRNTGWRESASNVIGLTKRVAAAVITTCTSTPALLQLAQHLAGLVGPDAARDAEDDHRHGAASATPPRSRALGAGQLVEHLPRHGLGERLLDRDAGGLAAARLDAGLGARLQLLGALRGHRDEAELASPRPSEESAGSCRLRLLSVLESPADGARAAPRPRRPGCAPRERCTSAPSTQASKSSLTTA